MMCFKPVDFDGFGQVGEKMGWILEQDEAVEFF